MKLIIDADPIVYRAGFAAEKRHWHGVIENAETGELDTVVKPSSKELKEYAAMIADLPGGVWRLIERSPMSVPEPVGYALHNVDMQIQGIAGALNKRGYTGQLQTTVLLTGPGNFREKIATIRPYKGNRDPLHKPVYYQAIRDFLADTYGARVIHGREADDETSILAHTARRDGIPYCVATMDKDLDQIPGLHYDYRQHVFYDISEDAARRALWIQILAGDSGDNVPGCFDIGRVRAEKFIDTDMSDAELWNHVVNLYAVSQLHPECPYKDAWPEAVALETARLVFLQTRPGEMWYPDGPLMCGGGNSYED